MSSAWLWARSRCLVNRSKTFHKRTLSGGCDDGGGSRWRISTMLQYHDLVLLRNSVSRSLRLLGNESEGSMTHCTWHWLCMHASAYLDVAGGGKSKIGGSILIVRVSCSQRLGGLQRSDTCRSKWLCVCVENLPQWKITNSLETAFSRFENREAPSQLKRVESQPMVLRRVSMFPAKWKNLASETRGCLAPVGELSVAYGPWW